METILLIIFWIICFLGGVIIGNGLSDYTIKGKSWRQVSTKIYMGLIISEIGILLSLLV